MLFLRSTNNAEKDLNGGYSFHQSDYKAGTLNWLEDETETEFVSKIFGCNEESIEIAEDGYYVQKLEGLCAYSLDSNDLKSALIEVSEMNFNKMESINTNNLVIFEGSEVSSEFIIEGTLFIPEKIIYKFN